MATAVCSTACCAQYSKNSLKHVINIYGKAIGNGGELELKLERTRTVAFAKRASPAARSRFAKPLATAGNSFGIGGASSARAYCHAVFSRGADQVAPSLKQQI